MKHCLQEYHIKWVRRSEIMKMVNILEYGAQENIDEAQTEKIQAAIDVANKMDGTVYIPKGVFKTGTLNLKNASLYIEKGAVLLGSEKPEDYVFNGFLHNELGECKALIYSMEGKGITIGGEGTINLNGKSFFDFSTHIVPENLKGKLNEEQLEETTAEYSFRPNQGVFFYRCSNITVKDVKLLDSPCWTLVFAECKGIRVENIVNIGHERIPNNDGIHLCGCEEAIITKCRITSADDCIALSGITDWDIPCENVVISDCVLKSFSKAIVLGYAQSIVRNVVVSNCVIRDSNRAFCIMASEKTGLVENVTVQNMILDTRVRAGNWWGNGEPILIMARKHTTNDLVDKSDSIAKRNFPVNVRNVLFSNLICTAENAIGVIGEGQNIDNVVFRDVRINLKESRNICVKGRTFELAPAKSVKGLEVLIENCIFCTYQAGNVELINVKGETFNNEPGVIQRI